MAVPASGKKLNRWVSAPRSYARWMVATICCSVSPRPTTRCTPALPRPKIRPISSTVSQNSSQRCGPRTPCPRYRSNSSGVAASTATVAMSAPACAGLDQPLGIADGRGRDQRRHGPAGLGVEAMDDGVHVVKGARVGDHPHAHPPQLPAVVVQTLDDVVHGVGRPLDADKGPPSEFPLRGPGSARSRRSAPNRAGRRSPAG